VLVQQREVVLLHAGGAHDRRGRAVQARDLAVREQAGGDAAVGQRRTDVVEILGLRVGQRLEQDRVQRAENRRGGADPERQRGDGGQRKRRGAAVTPEGEPQVLEQRIHWHSLCRRIERVYRVRAELQFGEAAAMIEPREE